MRAIHLAPLVQWIDATWLGERALRILDLGCGDMLLARLLPSGHVVDGVDVSEPARDAARAAIRRAGLSGVVLDDRSDVPLGAYDAVVISSVLQYLDGADELTETLRDVARWLAPGALGAIATDVPLPGESRFGDARDLVVELTRRSGAFSAARELVRSARRSPGDLTDFDEAVVRSCAGAAGLQAVRVRPNLSPFRSRASYELHARSASSS